MNGAECSFRAFQSGDASAAARFPATPLELQEFVEFTGGVAGGRDARTSPDLSDPFLLARSTKHEKARVEDGRRLLMPRRGRNFSRPSDCRKPDCCDDSFAALAYHESCKLLAFEIWRELYLLALLKTLSP